MIYKLDPLTPGALSPYPGFLSLLSLSSLCFPPSLINFPFDPNFGVYVEFFLYSLPKNPLLSVQGLVSPNSRKLALSCINTVKIDWDCKSPVYFFSIKLRKDSCNEDLSKQSVFLQVCSMWEFCSLKFKAQFIPQKGQGCAKRF